MLSLTRPVARTWNLRGAISITVGGGGACFLFRCFFLPFFPQTVYLKNIEVIEVCPTNLWKPFPMIKKKEVMVENECFFGRRLHSNASECEPNARQMRYVVECTPTTSRFLGVLRVARQKWDMLIFVGVARFRADSGECEANAWRTRDEPAESAIFNGFFRVAQQSSNKFVLVWQGL